MNHGASFHKAVGAILCVGLSILHPSLTAEAANSALAPSQRKCTVTDIELGTDGALHGAVVDTRGLGVGHATVVIIQGERHVATAVTKADGLFRIEHLKGGLYLVAAADSQRLCRVWSQGSAPPRATSSALVVAGDTVVRGQHPHYGNRHFYGGPVRPIRYNLYDWMAEHPLLAIGAVSAVIAVPIAVIAHQDDSKNALRDLVDGS